MFSSFFCESNYSLNHFISSEEVDAKLESMQGGQIYSPVKNHPQPQLNKMQSFPTPQIQRPIPQYPNQQRPPVQSQQPTKDQSSHGPTTNNQQEPYSTQSLYKNYPFEGFTRPIHSNSGQIATRSHNTQPKDNKNQTFIHPQQQPQQQQQPMHQQPPLPQQAKATLLQKFQENLSIHSPEKIAEMALMKECDIEKFAQDNLNLHSKGIFRKKVSSFC